MTDRDMTDLAGLARAKMGLPPGASDADLFSALLDWCAERGMDPMLYHHHADGLWECGFDDEANEGSDTTTHRTKHGTLLLALAAAGVIGGAGQPPIDGPIGGMH